MSDRFDLEQGLLNSWNIIEDLKVIIVSKRYDLLESIVSIYDFKFEQTFDIFGEIIQIEFNHRKKLEVLQSEFDKFKNDSESRELTLTNKILELAELNISNAKSCKQNCNDTMKHHTGSFNSNNCDNT